MCAPGKTKVPLYPSARRARSMRSPRRRSLSRAPCALPDSPADASCCRTTQAKPTSNEQKLALYALYKQATAGDCTGARPGIFSQTERYKYDAWKAHEGLAALEAKAAYIEEGRKQMEEHS